MNELNKQCVFIADDDDDDQFLLKLAFKQYSPKSHLLFAQDGLELLTLLAQTKLAPCLIILDLNMPRLNGFEALRILKHSPLYQDTPVVILTTSTANEDRHRAYELGASDYITKPIYFEQLGQIICQLKKKWQLDKWY